MSKQYHIRWRTDDKKELQRVVRNFNNKIDRLAKKDPQNKAALPEKMTVRQLKELIDTRQDLNRELNSLKRFTKRGAETMVDVPQSEYNLKITKWQKDEMSRRTGVVNRKRKKRLEEIQNIEMTSRGESLGYTRGQLGMGKADEIALMPVKAFTPKMTRTDLKKKFKSIQIQSQSTYFNRKDAQFKQNYITGILQNFSEADVSEVLDAIENMGFQEFYKKFQAEGGEFDFYPPDAEQYAGYVKQLKAIWTPNKQKA